MENFEAWNHECEFYTDYPHNHGEDEDTSEEVQHATE